MLDKFGGRPNSSSRVEDVTTGVHRGRSFLSARFFPDRAEAKQSDFEDETVRALAVSLPAPLPSLDVSRWSKFEGRLNRSVGLGSPRMGSSEFDERFLVNADDKQFAANVLQLPMQEWLVSAASAHSGGFWIYGNWIYLNGKHDVRNADGIAAGLDFLCDVIDRIPSQVWQPSR
jgi:hypothetical protein